MSLYLKNAGKLLDKSELLSWPIRDANVNIEKLFSIRAGFSLTFALVKVGTKGLIYALGFILVVFFFFMARPL